MGAQVKPLYPTNEEEPKFFAFEGRITETGGAHDFTVTVPIPAGAWIERIGVRNIADWTNGTSAVLKVGDTGDDDGWITACSVKAGGGCVAGESLWIDGIDTLGGVQGAYVAADMVKGRYSATARNVIFTVTTGAGAQTTGDLRVYVSYTLLPQESTIATVTV